MRANGPFLPKPEYADGYWKNDGHSRLEETEVLVGRNPEISIRPEARLPASLPNLAISTGENNE